MGASALVGIPESQRAKARERLKAAVLAKTPLLDAEEASSRAHTLELTCHTKANKVRFISESPHVKATN